MGGQSSTVTTGPLKGGLIGCGFFSANHLHGWRDVGVTIAAVCDRDADKARRTAETFGIARHYADAGAVLERERLDFVDIVTTVESHRALVELAASRGVPAICQKPFALNLTDGAAMVEACRRAGVPLMVHENFRWQAPLMAVKQAMGEIGRPAFARIAFRHGFDIYANQPYLAKQKRLAIEDIGIHVLDVARFLLGEVTRLYCRTQRLNPAVIGEDAATIVLDHAGGAVSVVDFSFFTQTEPDPFPQTLVRVEGDRGTVELEAGHRLVLTRQGARDVRDVEPPVPAWGAKPWHLIQDSVVTIQRHWAECLRAGTEPHTSGRDNLKTLALVEAAYASAASGEPKAFAA